MEEFIGFQHLINFLSVEDFKIMSSIFIPGKWSDGCRFINFKRSYSTNDKFRQVANNNLRILTLEE